MQRRHGTLHSIWIAERATEPLRSVARVRAVPGVGLEGDRYASERGTFSGRPSASSRDVSLIDVATVDDVARATGHDLCPGDLRRNLVVAGLELESLIGAVLRIGAVRLDGTGPCPPCGHLERVLGLDVRPSMRHRGGLRARIVAGGRLTAGSPIEIERPGRSLP